MSKILLVDDHVVIRAGIMNLLKKAFPKVEFLEAGTIDEATLIIGTQEIDLVLCDISLGKKSGLDLLQRFSEEAHFVMLSIFEEHVYARRCLDLGAKAYLNKGCDPDDLVRTIQDTLAEKASPITGKNAKPATNKSPLESLSQREREVLEDIANGLSLQEISQKRDIQYNTVKTYKLRVMEKTNCKHNTELLFFALKHGLVQPNG